MCMSAKWYCFLMDGHKTRGKNDLEVVIRREMEDIFGQDLVDICIIGERVTSESFEVQSESYFFVCCSNYSNHVKRIKKSTIISFVLPSIEDPDPVSDSEIAKFAHAVHIKKEERQLLYFGDVVKIKEGYLEGLHGVVLNRMKKKDKYEVYFSLFTRDFTEKLLRNNLVSSGSIFQHLRCPVVQEGRRFDILQLSDRIRDYIHQEMHIRCPVVLNRRGEITMSKLSEAVPKSKLKTKKGKRDERKVHRDVHRKRTTGKRKSRRTSTFRRQKST